MGQSESTAIITNAVVEIYMHSVNREAALMLFVGSWKEPFAADFLQHTDKSEEHSAASTFPGLPPGDHPVWLAYRSTGGFHFVLSLRGDNHVDRFSLTSGETPAITLLPNGYKMLDSPIFTVKVT